MIDATMPAMQDYRIQLETYSGPMDLLLYLIRREEVDIYDIPIARILEQYLTYVRLLEELDPEAVGDFLVLAATLMEIKSRLLLPKPPPEAGEDDTLDPRADLVRQLLAYRTFREAAGQLTQQVEVHARRFGRPPIEVPGDEGQVDLDDAQIWDLLAAFNKLMISVGAQRTYHEVKYDDTPIALHAVDILDRLQRDGSTLRFDQIFEGRTRSEMIGLFLALLELIRQRRIRIDQADRLGPIIVHLLDATPITEVVDEEEEAEALTEADFVEPQTGNGEEAAEATSGDNGERVLLPVDEEDESQEDDILKRIEAIRVADVDLGRSFEHEDTGEDDESDDQMSNV